jgi:hypothetical protein
MRKALYLLLPAQTMMIHEFLGVEHAQRVRTVTEIDQPTFGQVWYCLNNVQR